MLLYQKDPDDFLPLRSSLTKSSFTSKRICVVSEDLERIEGRRMLRLTTLGWVEQKRWISIAWKQKKFWYETMISYEFVDMKYDHSRYIFFFISIFFGMINNYEKIKTLKISTELRDLNNAT